jgi:hypothetical protein
MNGQQAVDNGLATGLLSADAMQEDVTKTADARATNAVRQAEIALCGSMTRTEARNLLAKIKGTPGAAQEPATPKRWRPVLAGPRPHPFSPKCALKETDHEHP